MVRDDVTVITCREQEAPIVGHILYRSAFSDAGREPVLAATLLAIVVAALAVQIVFKPRILALHWRSRQCTATDRRAPSARR